MSYVYRRIFERARERERGRDNDCIFHLLRDGNGTKQAPSRPRRLVSSISRHRTRYPFISMGLSRVSKGPSTDDVIDVRTSDALLGVHSSEAQGEPRALRFSHPPRLLARLMAASSRALSSDLPSLPPRSSALRAYCVRASRVYL